MTPLMNVATKLEEIRAGVSGPLRLPIDEARIAHAVREMLLGLGEDPDRDGLAGTPQRVARAYREIFSGIRQNPKRHLTRTFAHEGGADDLVMVRDIEIFSMCEHTGFGISRYHGFQGTTRGTGLAARAPPTARSLPGRPISVATHP